MEKGSRGAVTGEKLWQTMVDEAIGRVMTDHWVPYEAIVPKERYTRSKA
jgi:IS1 family transposase